jgi:NADPH:quinone reductase-like Zn-dependent oxidoreductase
MAAKKTILGQDPAVLLAVWANVLSWFIRKFAPSFLPQLLPNCDQEDTTPNIDATSRTRCISIGRPGGMEQLRLITLKSGIATCGYNVEGQDIPFTKPHTEMPSDCIMISNDAFSVNYADCCIRWGLYESAKQYVGYPIVPGFDIAGTVEKVGSESKFKPGDEVFGCTLFGAYSSRVLVPCLQMRKIPKGLSMADAAALPAVSLTALYALFLAGHYPTASRFTNKAILIHSAAGGVGSMLVQMSKILGLSPIVGVVGRTSKVEAAKALGCDFVIDKSTQNLWEAARAAAPNGYSTIMDSNGVSTLSQSYEHLAMTGRLVVFGFHTNLPMGSDMLSPFEWLRMAIKMKDMPKFDPMEMGASNKAVLAFNLSFFAQEKEMVTLLFDQVCKWLEEGKLKVPRVVEMEMEQIAQAHELIQSGMSIGKIILKT